MRTQSTCAFLLQYWFYVHLLNLCIPFEVHFDYFINNYFQFQLFSVIFFLISFSDSKCLACTYRAKFIEVSVGINHNVDELLAGILTQIRLKKEQNTVQVSSKHLLKKFINLLCKAQSWCNNVLKSNFFSKSFFVPRLLQVFFSAFRRSSGKFSEKQMGNEESNKF